MPKTSFGGYSGASKLNNNNNDNRQIINDKSVESCLKQLSKRDPKTKLKALNKLYELFDDNKRSSNEELCIIVPHWLFRYNRLALDNDRKVREALYKPLGILVKRLKKLIQPHLNNLFPNWWLHQFDPVKDVANIATITFEECFPEKNRKSVLEYCEKAVFKYMASNIAHNIESLSELELQVGGKFTLIDAQERYDRVLYSTLYSLSEYIKQIRCNPDNLSIFKITNKNKIWKFAHSDRPLVRKGWYKLMECLSIHYKEFVDKNLEFLAPILLKCLGESYRNNQKIMWQMLLLTLKYHPLIWERINEKIMKKSFYPRVWRLLETAGYGSYETLYHNLLPFFDHLIICKSTSNIEFFQMFFNSLWKGGIHIPDGEELHLKDINVKISSMIQAFGECMRLLFKKSPYEKEMLNDFIIPILSNRLKLNTESSDDTAHMFEEKTNNDLNIFNKPDTLPVVFGQVWGQLLMTRPATIEQLSCHAIRENVDNIIITNESLTLKLTESINDENIIQKIYNECMHQLSERKNIDHLLKVADEFNRRYSFLSIPVENIILPLLEYVLKTNNDVIKSYCSLLQHVLTTDTWKSIWKILYNNMENSFEQVCQCLIELISYNTFMSTCNSKQPNTYFDIVNVLLSKESDNNVSNVFIKWFTTMTRLPSNHQLRFTTFIANQFLTKHELLDCLKVPLKSRQHFQACFDFGSSNNNDNATSIDNYNENNDLSNKYYSKFVHQIFWLYIDNTNIADEIWNEYIIDDITDDVYFLANEIRSELFSSNKLSINQWVKAATILFNSIGPSILDTLLCNHEVLHQYIFQLMYKSNSTSGKSVNSEDFVANSLLILQRFIACMNQFLTPNISQYVSYSKMGLDILAAERELLNWVPTINMPVLHTGDNIDDLLTNDLNSLSSRLLNNNNNNNECKISSIDLLNYLKSVILLQCGCKTICSNENMHIMCPLIGHSYVSVLKTYIHCNKSKNKNTFDRWISDFTLECIEILKSKNDVMYRPIISILYILNVKDKILLDVIESQLIEQPSLALVYASNKCNVIKNELMNTFYSSSTSDDTDHHIALVSCCISYVQNHVIPLNILEYLCEIFSNASIQHEHFHWRFYPILLLYSKVLLKCHMNQLNNNKIILAITNFFCSVNFQELPLMSIELQNNIGLLIQQIFSTCNINNEIIFNKFTFDPTFHLNNPFTNVLLATTEIMTKYLCFNVSKQEHSKTMMTDHEKETVKTLTRRRYLTEDDLIIVSGLITHNIRDLIEHPPPKELDESLDAHIKVYLLAWDILLRVLTFMAKFEENFMEERKLLLWAWLRDGNYLAPFCGELIEHIYVNMKSCKYTLKAIKQYQKEKRLDDILNESYKHEWFIPNSPSVNVRVSNYTERLRFCHNNRSEDIEHCFYTPISTLLYLRVLHVLPALVYMWCLSTERTTSNAVLKLTREHFSHILIREEIQSLNRLDATSATSTTTNNNNNNNNIIYNKNNTIISDVDLELDTEAEMKEEEEDSSSIANDVDGFIVRGNMALSQISARFINGDFKLSLNIKLPASFPLEPVEICFDEYRGVTEARARRWELTTASILSSHNGSILQAIHVWRKNINKHLEGIEECPICYSIVHATSHQLPRMSCSTCKHHFHSLCLYRWFNTSGSSTCPLCRSLF